MSRAYTEEELRGIFIDGFKHLADYWARECPNDSARACEGLAFSMLVMIDGCSSAFPCSVDLVMRPHPDDKAFLIEEGENWVGDGMVINSDVALHDEFYGEAQ